MYSIRKGKRTSLLVVECDSCGQLRSCLAMSCVELAEQLHQLSPRDPRVSIEVDPQFLVREPLKRAHDVR